VGDEMGGVAATEQGSRGEQGAERACACGPEERQQEEEAVVRAVVAAVVKSVIESSEDDRGGQDATASSLASHPLLVTCASLHSHPLVDLLASPCEA
jgi:hypothetical protein